MVLSRCSLAALAFLAVPALLVTAPTLPRNSPEFSLQMLDGVPLPVGQFKGKVVVLVFILTDCPRCQQIVNTLAKAQAEYDSRGFQVLVSAIDDMAATSVRDFVKRLHPPFPVGYSSRNVAVQYLEHPPEDRLLMPQIVFLDRDARIQAQYAGDEPFLAEDAVDQNLQMKIEELLRQPAPDSKRGGARKKKS